MDRRGRAPRGAAAPTIDVGGEVGHPTFDRFVGSLLRSKATGNFYAKRPHPPHPGEPPKGADAR